MAAERCTAAACDFGFAFVGWGHQQLFIEPAGCMGRCVQGLVPGMFILCFSFWFLQQSQHMPFCSCSALRARLVPVRNSWQLP